MIKDELQRSYVAQAAYRTKAMSLRDYPAPKKHGKGANRSSAFSGRKQRSSKSKKSVHFQDSTGSSDLTPQVLLPHSRSRVGVPSVWGKSKIGSPVVEGDGFLRASRRSELDQSVLQEDRGSLPDVSLTDVGRQFPTLFTSSKIQVVNRHVNIIDRVPHQFRGADTIYLSNNRLVDISGIEQFQELKTLSLAHNDIVTVDSLMPLSRCPKLKYLKLEGCPLCERPFYRLHVVRKLPHVHFLDRKEIAREERLGAKYIVEKEGQMHRVLYENHCLIHKLKRFLFQIKLRIDFRSMKLGHKRLLVPSTLPHFPRHQPVDRVNTDTFLKAWNYESLVENRLKYEIREDLVQGVLKFWKVIVKQEALVAYGKGAGNGPKHRPATSWADSFEVWEEAFSQMMTVQQNAILRLKELCEEAKVELRELEEKIEARDPRHLIDETHQEYEDAFRSFHNTPMKSAMGMSRRNRYVDAVAQEYEAVHRDTGDGMIGWEPSPNRPSVMGALSSQFEQARIEAQLERGSTNFNEISRVSRRSHHNVTSPEPEPWADIPTPITSAAPEGQKPFQGQHSPDQGFQSTRGGAGGALNLIALASTPGPYAPSSPQLRRRPEHGHSSTGQTMGKRQDATREFGFDEESDSVPEDGGELPQNAVHRTTLSRLLDVLKSRRSLYGRGLTDLPSLFLAIDRNADGLISKGEFMDALRRLDVGFSNKQRNQFFRIFDWDKGSNIDFVELERGITAELETTEAMEPAYHLLLKRKQRKQNSQSHAGRSPTKALGKSGSAPDEGANRATPAKKEADLELSPKDRKTWEETLRHEPPATPFSDSPKDRLPVSQAGPKAKKKSPKGKALVHSPSALGKKANSRRDQKGVASPPPAAKDSIRLKASAKPKASIKPRARTKPKAEKVDETHPSRTDDTKALQLAKKLSEMNDKVEKLQHERDHAVHQAKEYKILLHDFVQVDDREAMAVEFYKTSMLQKTFYKWSELLSLSRHIYRKVKQAVKQQRSKRLKKTWRHWVYVIRQRKYLQSRYVHAEKTHSRTLLSRVYLAWYNKVREAKKRKMEKLFLKRKANLFICRKALAKWCLYMKILGLEKKENAVLHYIKQLGSRTLWAWKMVTARSESDRIAEALAMGHYVRSIQKRRFGKWRRFTKVSMSRREAAERKTYKGRWLIRASVIVQKAELRKRRYMKKLAITAWSKNLHNMRQREKAVSFLNRLRDLNRAQRAWMGWRKYLFIVRSETVCSLREEAEEQEREWNRAVAIIRREKNVQEEGFALRELEWEREKLQIQGRVNSMSEEMERLDDQAREKANKTMIVSRGVRSVANDLEGLMVEVAKLRKENEMLSEENSLTNGRVKDLEARLVARDKKMSQMLEEATGINDKLQQVEGEKATVKEKLEEAKLETKNEILKASKCADEWSKEKRSLKKEIKSLKKMVHSVEQQLNVEEDARMQVEKEMGETQAAAARDQTSMEMKLESSLGLIKDLKLAVEGKSHEISILLREKESFEHIIAQLNETIKKMEADHRDEIFEKNERIAALEADLMNCRTRCQQLEARIAECEKLLREKNILIRNLKQAITLFQNPHKENIQAPRPRPKAVIKAPEDHSPKPIRVGGGYAPKETLMVHHHHHGTHDLDQERAIAAAEEANKLEAEKLHAQIAHAKRARARQAHAHDAHPRQREHISGELKEVQLPTNVSTPETQTLESHVHDDDLDMTRRLQAMKTRLQNKLTQLSEQ